MNPLSYLTDQGVKAWGVIDRRSPRASFWREAFGSDAVELESSEIHSLGSIRFVRVKVSALGPDQLERYSRMMARRVGCAAGDIWMDAVHGGGITLDVTRVHVTDDPDVGRAFWESIEDLRKSESEGS
jgi:hypothetical protein